ncbi:putative diguanylate cyclase YdaM [compost metagenome]
MRLALAVKAIAAGGVEPFGITVSIGVAQHQGHPDENYLIKAADDALYRAKQNGRNRVEQDRRGV